MQLENKSSKQSNQLDEDTQFTLENDKDNDKDESHHKTKLFTHQKQLKVGVLNLFLKIKKD